MSWSSSTHTFGGGWSTWDETAQTPVSPLLGPRSTATTKAVSPTDLVGIFWDAVNLGSASTSPIGEIASTLVETVLNAVNVAEFDGTMQAFVEPDQLDEANAKHLQSLNFDTVTVDYSASGGDAFALMSNAILLALWDNERSMCNEACSGATERRNPCVVVVTSNPAMGEVLKKVIATQRVGVPHTRSPTHQDRNTTVVR